MPATPKWHPRFTWWALAALVACSGGKGGVDVTPTPGDGDGNGGDGSSQTPPAPYDALQWDIGFIDGDSPIRAAGYQGRLVRDNTNGAGRGTLYYAYLKDYANVATCNIAIFGGDAAPGVNYTLKVAVRAPSAITWTVETVDLSTVPATNNVPYITNRYGLDALLDSQGRLVLAFAGGGNGQFNCGSSDLVIATRNSASNWTFQVPVADSGACCTVPDCSDPACASGTDVGPWAAVTLNGNNQLAAMYLDYHFNTDQDGVAHRGLELWEAASGVSGMRPWSGEGLYGVLRYVQSSATAPFAGLIAAYTSTYQTGLYIARRTGTSGTVTDWQETDLRPLWKIGERINLVVAPNGTLGLAFHAMNNNAGQLVNDLYYCSSTDNGATWSQPCDNIDIPSLNLGNNPSLAFDRQSRPVLSYYVCGATANCTESGDALKYAWRDDTGKWWTFTAVANGATRAGYFSQVVLDPDTDVPTIVYQDLTTGAAMVAQGRFQ